jgi:hypothetical protein
MNERIKELIVQSGNGQFHNDKCYPHIGSRTLEDWKKFAELIVQECLDACSRANEIRHFVPPTQQQVVLSCMREIEKHFGVE